MAVCIIVILNILPFMLSLEENIIKVDKLVLFS